MTDIEIAQGNVKENIVDVAKRVGLKEKDLLLYGTDKAKINYSSDKRKAKLVLVTAINPTPYGEGKTTVSIGLADGIHKLGKNVCLALREP